MRRPHWQHVAVIHTVQVTPIVDDVRQRGDAAVQEYTAKFDKCELEAPCVPVAELPEPQLPQEVTDAFDVAYDNIRQFHEAQAGPELSVETMPGVVCRQVRAACACLHCKPCMQALRMHASAALTHHAQ